MTATAIQEATALANLLRMQQAVASELNDALLHDLAGFDQSRLVAWGKHVADLDSTLDKLTADIVTARRAA